MLTLIVNSDAAQTVPGESQMQNFFTRTLFATAMIALILNNGLDVWLKLRPKPTETASIVPAILPAPQGAIQNPVNPAPPVIRAPEIQQAGQAIPAAVAEQLAQAIPAEAPLNPVVKPEPSRDHMTARTPEQVSRLLAAIAAENPRTPALTGVQLLPKCVGGKCGRR